MKGVCDPLVGDTPRIGAKRQIGSWNPGNNAKRQVWNTIGPFNILRYSSNGITDTGIVPDTGTICHDSP
jgi:hypothetical protein